MSEPNKHHTIKSWAEDDRPREKLMLKGKASLSNAELIAILIGSGIKDHSAVDLAKNILTSVDNNLNNLSKLNVHDLCNFRGIGEAKAIAIITALEIGARRRSADALERNRISSSKDVFELMQPYIGDLDHEEFWVIYLSNANEVLQTSQQSKGGITGTVADIRPLFKKALQLNATAIIVSHNHPSGQLKPSHADRTLTKKIKDAGQIMDIKLLDHVIITQLDYFSFADEGII